MLCPARHLESDEAEVLEGGAVLRHRPQVTGLQGAHLGARGHGAQGLDQGQVGRWTSDKVTSVYSVDRCQVGGGWRSDEVADCTCRKMWRKLLLLGCLVSTERRPGPGGLVGREIELGR